MANVATLQIPDSRARVLFFSLINGAQPLRSHHIVTTAAKDPLLELRGVVDADVADVADVRLLRLLVSMENRVVQLARGEYKFEADADNFAHNSNSANRYSLPVWRQGYGRVDADHLAPAAVAVARQDRERQVVGAGARRLGAGGAVERLQHKLC